MGYVFILRQGTSGWETSAYTIEDERILTLIAMINEPEPPIPPEDRRRVTASVLRVRTGPGLDYPAIDAQYMGDIVTIYELSGEWGRIGEGRWASTVWMVKL